LKLPLKTSTICRPPEGTARGPRFSPCYATAYCMPNFSADISHSKYTCNKTDQFCTAQQQVENCASESNCMCDYLVWARLGVGSSHAGTK